MSCKYSSKTINLKDFNRICRTCLGVENVGPIFGTTIADLKATELLNYCVSVEVDQSDLLPQNICENCLNELFRMYEFKNQCQENEAVLKLLVDNAQSESTQSKEKTDDEDEEFSCNITLIEEDAEYKCDPSDCEDADSNDKTEELKCRDCGEVCSTREDLKEHRKVAKHIDYRSHKCDVCHKTFTRSKLRQHMRSHTKEKPYQCKVCLQSFSMNGNLKRHSMTHTGERPHVCSTCGKGFIQATSLRAHEKVHAAHDDKLLPDSNGAMKFTCDICGRRFKRLVPFKAHLDRHNTYTIAAKKNEDKSAVSGSGEHVCEICARTYKTKHLLKAHRLTHGEKTFLCSDCGKGFITKAALQSHLKVHTGEKPHTCVICKKSFAHVGSFDSHMLIHSGLKPYSCSFCPKSFTQLSHLTYHLRTHSGERPYSCSYCGKSFALKGNLTVHVRTHTGETPYVCPVCGKGFYDSSSMKKHQRNHRDDGGSRGIEQQEHYQIHQVNVSCS